MLYQLRAINKVQIKEEIQKEVLKTLGYTFLDQYDNSRFMNLNQILKQMKTPNSQYKFKNLGYDFNYHIVEKSITPIEIEKYFHYNMVYIDKTTGEYIARDELYKYNPDNIIKGWRLRAIENAVDKSFTCNSTYHGYPVISVSRAFNSMVESNLDLTKMDVSGIIDCSELFSEISFIDNLDISTWEMPNLAHAEKMLGKCLNLKTLKMGKITLPLKTNMKSLIPQIECIKTLEINEKTYGLFKQVGIRKHTTPENEENQIVKAKLLGITPPIFTNIKIV